MFDFPTPGLTGARDIDAYFAEQLKSTGLAEPQPGEGVQGYRVYYEYCGKLFPPLVGAPKDEHGVKQYATLSYIAEHPDAKIRDKEHVRGMSKNIPYGEDTGQGYYYWPTQAMAEEFLHIIAKDFGRLDQGPQKKYAILDKDNKVFAVADRPHSQYKSEQVQGFGRLGVYKVQGTAGSNIKGDGGFVMSDIFVPEQEPISPINVGEAYNPPLTTWDDNPEFE